MDESHGELVEGSQRYSGRDGTSMIIDHQSLTTDN